MFIWFLYDAPTFSAPSSNSTLVKNSSPLSNPSFHERTTIYTTWPLTTNIAFTRLTMIDYLINAHHERDTIDVPGSTRTLS